MGLFAGDSIPTIKWEAIGQPVSGVVVGFADHHRSEYSPTGDGEKLYWSGTGGKKKPKPVPFDADGNPNQPVMDKVVMLHDGESERRLFVKGQRMVDAIKAAIVEARARDVNEGGVLTGTWTGGAATMNSPREFKFTYEPPVDGRSVGDAIAEFAKNKTGSTEQPSGKPSGLFGRTTVTEDDAPPF